MGRCVQGDTAAWREIIRQYAALIAHAARETLKRVLGSVESNELEDILQSVWTSLCEDNCRRLRSFESRCSLSSWLTILTTRRTIDHIRTQKRKGSLRNISLEVVEADLVKDLHRNPDYAGDEDRDLLHNAMEQLPEKQRLLLKLYYFDRLSHQTIAEMLHLSPNTISSSLMRARQSLKALFAHK